MKKNLLVFFILVSLCAKAQVYNNEWIDYSKTYYKFKIGATALYRINQPLLATLGIANTPVPQFQLWRNGKEVPLYTSVQTGVLGSTDYLEFWGERNDGKPDKVLYRDPNFQLSDKWSLESDTASFFLTINPAGNNLRYVPVANNLPSTLPVEPYFMDKAAQYYTSKINKGFAAVVGEYVYSSAYDDGEGWTSTDVSTSAIRTGPASYNISYGSTAKVTFANLQVAPTGPSPSITIGASGNSSNPRKIKLALNGDTVLTRTMDFFDHSLATENFPVSLISGNTAEITITNNAAVSCPVDIPGQASQPCGTDRMVVHKIEMDYPRLFKFGGETNFEFDLPANSLGNYLEISGINFAGWQPSIYDVTNGKRYLGDISNPAFIKVVLEPSATQRHILVVSENPSHRIDISQSLHQIVQRNFIDYNTPANRGDYLIISHPSLTVGAGGSNPVNDYKDYRNSAAGGGFTAKTYMIDQLMDQFGLGIKNNPLSVRNFLRWARVNFNLPLKNVLLIGKGVTYYDYRFAENTDYIERLALIPTFGYPASDNLLAAEPGSDQIQKVPIGRLSVIYPQEVADYLEKVKEYEQAQAFSSPLIKDKAWMKNTVNAIGASDVSLGAILTSGMNKYKTIYSDTLYGANVNSFSKVTAAPVEQASSEKLYGLFEEGLSMLTYFGHSSASTLEFNLDHPENYNNQGKYPVTFVMGCNAGNFYSANSLRLIAKETLSEKFVLTKQRGSIAFIASTHFGIVHYLDILNTNTSYAASVSKYGKSIGEILKESTVQTFNLTSQNDYYARFHCEQSTLHGDPALKMDASWAKPDYVIEDQLLKVNPNFVSVAESSFKVDAKFMNIGKAVDKKIVIEVKRTFPDLTTEVVRRDTIRGIRYMDSLSYEFPIVATRDKGLNKISFCIDADNAVDELYETNNCITRDVFIFEDEARPVFPYDFTIVNKQDVKLIASTANPFSPSKQYTMEMDTTELFNSSAKVTRTLTSTGGVMEFAPGITMQDSTVYYWRVAPVPTTGQPIWNKSSFVFLNSPSGIEDPGYNQSHFYQHTKSKYERVYLDSTDKKFKYGDRYNNLFLNLGTWITSGCAEAACLAVSVNGVKRIRLVCWFSSLVFNVLDPVSFELWQNQTVVPNTYPATLGEGLYQSTDNYCFSDLKRYNFEYRYTDTSSRHKIMNFMQNVVPDGYYVIVRNFTLAPVYGYPNAWANEWAADTQYWGAGQSVYHFLRNVGFTGIDSFYRARPWGIVYKKNDPTFKPKWIVGDSTTDNPVLSVDCPTVDTLGYVTSPKFGPAKAWHQLKWRGTADAVGDSASVSVIGIRKDGTETILFDNLTTAQQDVDVSSINATLYPYTKLKLRTEDVTNFTPYQLRYWRITYDPVPEGAIAPNIYLKVKDTVEVGEPYDYKVAFKNISKAAFDSLKVKVVVTDRNNVPHIIPQAKKRPLLTSPNDTLQMGVVINTASLAGANTVYVEANPDDDQPEQQHFNNFTYRNLYVKPDSLNPVLDVTFDGVRILNNDIVSAKPEILIKLTDEAKWLVLDDTALLTLQVRNVKTGVTRSYNFNSDTLTFIPAGQAPNPNNTATIVFKPYFPDDAEYELYVTGKDKSANTAGKIEYRVLFEVINKPMISNMLNYPNPFTTSTAFVFTVTGSEVPQNIKIEIMTITGKIVREITKDELGPLHIGRNITEFKWDGTDQYGQKLANGIYLYRVVTNLNGKSLDKYQQKGDNTDKYFNKGYGKMYLMR